MFCSYMLLDQTPRSVQGQVYIVVMDDVAASATGDAGDASGERSPDDKGDQSVSSRTSHEVLLESIEEHLAGIKEVLEDMLNSQVTIKMLLEERLPKPKRVLTEQQESSEGYYSPSTEQDGVGVQEKKRKTDD